MLEIYTEEEAQSLADDLIEVLSQRHAAKD